MSIFDCRGSRQRTSGGSVLSTQGGFGLSKVSSASIRRQYQTLLDLPMTGSESRGSEMSSAATPVMPTQLTIEREQRLLRLALDLGAACSGGALSEAERGLLQMASALEGTPGGELSDVAASIRAGHDPLGARFCSIRMSSERRETGVFYTPPEIVEPMVEWVMGFNPTRVVDAGCGSGRFVASIARRRKDLRIVAVDLDPLQTILTRAVLKVLGAVAATVLHVDYTGLDLPRCLGRTAFIGNPPYVRHHQLTPDAKEWAVRTARRLGLRLSALAGLHVYFYLATARYARPGDLGCFVTSAEWLDVNYGHALRRLLLDNLGVRALHLVDPRAVPFADAMTTAVIACFEVGSAWPTVRFRTVGRTADLHQLDGGSEVSSDALRRASRWTLTLSARDGTIEDDTARLGEIARVHRGLVTGANDFFILSRDRAAELGISAWCRPAIVGADEILSSNGIIRDAPERRLLLDVPPSINRSAHPELDAYLRRGEEAHGDRPPIDSRYIPSHRHPWWFLGHWRPAPIVVSYMARRPPRFALNPDGLAIVNVAHGIYPKRALSPDELKALVVRLNEARDSFRGNGRTYHGGLEKFEPREMEALRFSAKGIL